MIKTWKQLNGVMVKQENKFFILKRDNKIMKSFFSIIWNTYFSLHFILTTSSKSNHSIIHYNHQPIVISAIQNNNYQLIATSNLTCFTCSSISQEECGTINETNYYLYFEDFAKECLLEENLCTVMRVEYVTSNLRSRKLWGIERKCARNCYDGCMVMGKSRGIID